jgi:lipoprotein-anchoring transpeptidase ErfK/SrfK
MNCWARKLYRLVDLTLTTLGVRLNVTQANIPVDWTQGGIALENEDIRELYKAVNVGTTVIIRP